MSQEEEFDLIVIGGGAGLKLGRPVADLGYKVAVIEKDKLGGTCLNRGCIPSKMLIHPADVALQIRFSDKYHIKPNQHPKVYFDKLVHSVTKVIDQESEDLIVKMHDHPNVTFFHEQVHFIAPKKIQLSDRVITAPKIILAVGARPHIPSIEGLSSTPFMTSTEALRLDRQPKKLIILGGGYIATELGHYFEALGTEVCFVVRSELLRTQDEDIRKAFQVSSEKRFKLYQGYKIHKVDHKENHFSLWIQKEKDSVKKLEADALLVTTGVTPNTDLLNLEKTNITQDEKGFIIVNEKLETTEKGVYAFGDVIGRYFFRHTANFEGEYLFNSLFVDKQENAINYPPVPYAVFTSPQVAGVGKLESQLISEGIPFFKGINKYQQSAMGMALRSDEGFVKLLFHQQTQKLLGAHIIGEEASDMIHMLIAYMKMGACLNDLLSTIYIHPALPEIVRNAARKAKEALNHL